MKNRIYFQISNLSVFFLVLTLNSLHGQIAHFPFNSDLDDVVNGYMPTFAGTPTIMTDGGDQVLQLEGDEYLTLPSAVHQAIDPNQDVEIQLKFKITDLYATTPFAGTGEFGDDGIRILLSNKANIISDLGFDISVQEMDEEYRLLMSFGDDGNEGVWMFNNAIQEDTWIDLRLIFRLNDDTPNVVYKLNGYYNYALLNLIDANLLKTSLNTQQLWLGTDTNNNISFGGFAYAETSIDYLKIYSPASTGDIGLFTTALSAMTNHVNGTNVLTVAQQQTEFNTIIANLDNNVSTIFSSDIMDYITAYEAAFGTVFQFYTEYIDPMEVSIPRALQFMLIQYSVDNLYTNANVANMAGVAYLDHTITPGIVAAAAPRVNQSTNIDGDYNTNPGYFLNQEQFVIRPTGYYAAPGEIVDINVPTLVAR